MSHTVASLARRTFVTQEVLAHCAGLRAVGRQSLAENIESGNLYAHVSYSDDVAEAMESLRRACEMPFDAVDTPMYIEDAFDAMLRCTRDGYVTDGIDNATYSAARAEASRRFVDAIEAMRGEIQ